MIEMIISTDKTLFYWMNQNLYTSLLDPVMIFLTTISNFSFFWLCIVVWLFVKRKQIGSLPGLTLFISLGIAFVVDSVLNAVVNRSRPPLTEEGIRQLVDLPFSSSFPSGHALSSFSAMYVLLYFFPKVKYWAPVLAFLFAYSRIYVGVHYPVDIIAGAFIGISIGMITTKMPLQLWLTRARGINSKY